MAINNQHCYNVVHSHFVVYLVVESEYHHDEFVIIILQKWNLFN